MLKSIYIYIARFLCLILAFHILNLKVGVPKNQERLAAFESVGSFAEVDNLLEMVLEIDIEALRHGSFMHGDCEKDAEKESPSDSFDVFHHHNRDPAILNDNIFLSGHHKPCNHVKSRSMEITSPPPKG